MTAGDHGAAAAALGYLYQFDWALVEVLEAYPEHADRRLSIEKLDASAGKTTRGLWRSNSSSTTGPTRRL